jgi:predicted DNA-binding WGR domain protein
LIERERKDCNSKPKPKTNPKTNPKTKPVQHSKETRYFVLEPKKHQSGYYWILFIYQNKYDVHYGKLRTNGQMETKIKRGDDLSKMIDAKLKKGYRECDFWYWDTLNAHGDLERPW